MSNQLQSFFSILKTCVYSKPKFYIRQYIYIDKDFSYEKKNMELYSMFINFPLYTQIFSRSLFRIF